MFSIGDEVRPQPGSFPSEHPARRDLSWGHLLRQVPIYNIIGVPDCSEIHGVEVHEESTPIQTEVSARGRARRTVAHPDVELL